MNKREKAELKALGKRLAGHRPQATGHRKSTKKNLFGFGRGTPRSQVERQKKKAAHAALDRGDHREARRLSRMSTRRFAKKRGIKVEGRFRGEVRTAKDKARAKAHGIIDRIFGGNPSQKQNPIPALLGSLGSAIEQGAGYATGAALGTEAFKDLEGRKRTVKKKKSKKRKESSYREYKRTGRIRGPKGKRKKKNPPARRRGHRKPISFAQAVARIRRAGRERGAKAVKIKV